MNQDKQSKILTIVLAIALVVVCALGVTYAYFTANIKGNDTAKETKVTTGTLDIIFETSQYIKNKNATLIPDSERETKADYTEFTVKHNKSTDVEGIYHVYLTEITISDNFKSPDVKWELVKNGTVLQQGNFADIGNATTIRLTKENEPQTLPYDKEDTLVFRIWLSETDQDQLSLTSGSLKGRIMVEATSKPY